MEVAMRAAPSPTPSTAPRRRCLLCRADFAYNVDEEACASGYSDIERLSAVVDATIVLTAGGGPPWWGNKLLCPDCDLALDEISRALKNRLAIRRCFIKNVATLHACGVVAPPAPEPVVGLSSTAFDEHVGAECEAADGRRDRRSECPLVGRVRAAAAHEQAAACDRRHSSPCDRGRGEGLRSREDPHGRRRCSPCTAQPLQPVGEKSGGCSSPAEAAVAAASQSAFSAAQKQGHVIVPAHDATQGHLDDLKDGESSENYTETPGCCNGGTADRCPSYKRKSTSEDCVQVEAGPHPGPRKLSRLLQTLSCAAAGGHATSPPATVVSAPAVSAVQPPLLESENPSSAATDANVDGNVSASSALRRLSMVLGVERASSSQASLPPSNHKPLSCMNPLGPAVSVYTPEAATAGSTKHPRWSPAVESATASAPAGVNHAASARQQMLFVDSKAVAHNDSRQASVTALQLGQTAPEADATASMACRAESQRQQMLRSHASDTETSEHCPASPRSVGQASNVPAQQQQQQHMVLSAFLASLAQPRPQLQQQAQLAASLMPMAVTAERRMHGLNTPSSVAGSQYRTLYQNPSVSACAGATGLHQQLPTATAIASQPPAGGGRSQLHSPVPTSAALPISTTSPCSLPPSSINACSSQASLERAHCRPSASGATTSGLALNFVRSTGDSQEHVPQQQQLETSSVKSGTSAACLSQLLAPPASSAAAIAIDATVVSSLPSQAQLSILHSVATSVSASTELLGRSKSPPAFTQAAAAITPVELAAASGQGCADQVSANGKECSAIRQGPWKLPDRGSAMTTLWKLLQQPVHPGQEQSQLSLPGCAISVPVNNSPVGRHVQDRDTATCKTPVSESTQLGSRTTQAATAAGGICDSAAAAPLSFLVRSAAARALVESPLSAVRSNSSSTTGTCRRSPNSGCGDSSRGVGGNAVGATMPLLAGMFEKLCEPPNSLPPPRSSMNPAAAAASAAAAAASVARRSTQLPPSTEQPQQLDVVNLTSRMPQEVLPHPLKRLRRYSLGHRYQRSPSNGGLGHTSFSNDPCRRRLIRTAAVQRLSPNMFGSSSSVIGKVECIGDEADACADEHGNEDFILGESEHLSYGMQSRHPLPATDASASGNLAVDLSNEAFLRPARLELKSEPLDV